MSDLRPLCIEWSLTILAKQCIHAALMGSFIWAIELSFFTFLEQSAHQISRPEKRYFRFPFVPLQIIQTEIGWVISGFIQP